MENLIDNNNDFDIVEKTNELYNEIADNLTIDKLISLKTNINLISNECKKYSIFNNAIERYNDFVKSIDEIEDKNSRLIAAWNHMDDRIANAHTSLHFKGAIILTIPILDHVLESF